MEKTDRQNGEAHGNQIVDSFMKKGWKPRNMRIRSRLLLLFFVTAVLPWLVLTLGLDQFTARLLKDHLQGSLEEVHLAKWNRLSERAEALDGRVMVPGFMKSVLSQYVDAGADENSRAFLDGVVKDFIQSRGFLGLMVIAPNGNVLYDSDVHMEDRPANSDPALKEVQAVVRIAPFHSAAWSEFGYIYRGELLVEGDAQSAIVTVKLDRRFLLNALGIDPEVETEDEVKVFVGAKGHRDIRLLNDEEKGDETSFTKKTEAVGETEYIVQVPTWGLVVSAHIDKDAVLAPLQKQRMVAMWIGLMTLGIVVLGATIADRSITRPLSRLRKTVQEMAGGRMDQRVMIVGRDEIADLGIAFNLMTKNLQKSYEEVRKRSEELEKAQSELMKSEKLAVLGQVGAGIAHEVNTPLAAVQSSAENIIGSVEYLLETLPDFFDQLDKKQTTIFFKLAALSVHSTHKELSTRDARKVRRALQQELEAAGLEDPRKIADTLVDLGVRDQLDPYFPLLKHARIHHVLEMAYRLGRLSRNAEIIRKSGDQAGRVVKAMKKFSRISHQGEVEMVSADITDGIETALMLLNHEIRKGVQVIRNYDAISVYCNPDELNRAWTNLVHNAIQAMNGDGTLTISVQPSRGGIDVRFHDTGCGISSDIRGAIFEPFFTTKPAGEGVGLGLDFVKRVIEMHQGTIELKSVPGSTEFIIWLPAERIPETGEEKKDITSTALQRVLTSATSV